MPLNLMQPLNANPGERQLDRVPRHGERGDVEVRDLQAVRPGAADGRGGVQDHDRVGGLRLQPVVPPGMDSLQSSLSTWLEFGFLAGFHRIRPDLKLNYGHVFSKIRPKTASMSAKLD